MAETVFNIAKKKFADGTLDWDSGDIRCLIIEGTVGAAATNPDSSTLAAALTGSTEAAGSGATRKTLAGKTVTQDNSNNRAVATATAPVWTAANWGTANALLVYLHVDGTDANDIPVSLHDTGFPITTNGGNLTVNFGGVGNDEVLVLA